MGKISFEEAIGYADGVDTFCDTRYLQFECAIDWGIETRYTTGLVERDGKYYELTGRGGEGIYDDGSSISLEEINKETYDYRRGKSYRCF